MTGDTVCAVHKDTGGPTANRLMNIINNMALLIASMVARSHRSFAEAARRWNEYVLTCFGASRMVWGSDWPVLERSSSYGQWWGETQQLLAYLSPQEQAAILGENAKRLYQL